MSIIHQYGRHLEIALSKPPPPLLRSRGYHISSPHSGGLFRAFCNY